MMKVLRPSPQYMARLRHGAILAALVFNAVSGLRYDLEGELSTLSYSEGWMFGSERGPIWTENGPSFIDVDLNVTMSPMESASLSNVSLLFYGTEVMEFLDTNLNICGRQTQLPSNFQDVEMMSFPVKEVVSKEDGDVLHQAHVVAHHDVPRSGLQYAYFQICSAYRVVETQLYADGQVTFRNPYGYLQGMYFGLLPFELGRMLLSLILDGFYILLMYRHRDTILPVHFAIMGVLTLASLEAASWFGAYSYMNNSGTPYCCPFPGAVILAMTMEVLRRTAARLLLLVICLGYGITRITLDRVENIAVATLTVAFFASSMLDSVTLIATSSSIKADGAVTTFTLPALLCDIVYLSWIYNALAHMLKELKEKSESYKHQMYTSLAWTTGSFVTLCFLLAVLMLTSEAGKMTWEWEFEWFNVVSWEILNLVVLSAVCIIWRPTPRSSMLAFSKQLATTEEGADDADEVEMGDMEDFQEVPGGAFTIEGNDPDGERGEEVEPQQGSVTVVNQGRTGEEPGRGSGGGANLHNFSGFAPQPRSDLT